MWVGRWVGGSGYKKKWVAVPLLEHKKWDLAAQRLKILELGVQNAIPRASGGVKVDEKFQNFRARLRRARGNHSELLATELRHTEWHH